MSENLKLAIAEAAQAQELAHRAALELHKKLVAENPLAADLFLAHLAESQKLNYRLKMMQINS